MTRLDGPRHAPARGRNPQQLVILVHGYGADGEDLIGLAPYLAQALPDAAFVAPNGPEPCDMSPMGRQWFGIDFDDPSRMGNDPHAAMDRFTRMLPDAEGVAPLLHEFIDGERDRYGLTDRQVALVGFSQGTMMSLHVGLRRATPLAGIVGFSGALLGAERLTAEMTSPAPIQLIHGDADDLVPPMAMFAAAGALGRAGLPVGFHVSRGTGHSIAMDGIETAASFLQDVFSTRLTASGGIASPL